MSGAVRARRFTAVETVTGATPAPAALAKAAAQGLCPRCGSKTLFAGWVAFAPSCAVCDLDYTAFNVGDGPAALLTLVLGAIIVTMALTLEIAAHPPFWVHMLLWIPVTAAGVVGALRVAKAALVGQEYRNAAREGRLKRPEE